MQLWTASVVQKACVCSDVKVALASVLKEEANTEYQ